MQYRNDIVPVEPTKGSNRQKYDGSMGRRILGFAETGMWPEEWVCELGITMRTLYAWARSYPEFAEQVEQAWHVLHAYWARLVRQNIGNPAFRQTMALRIMAKRFPSTWGREPINTLENFLGHVGEDETSPQLQNLGEAVATLTIEQVRNKSTEELEKRITVLEARRRAFLEGKAGG